MLKFEDLKVGDVVKYRWSSGMVETELVLRKYSLGKTHFQRRIVIFNFNRGFISDYAYDPENFYNSQISQLFQN